MGWKSIGENVEAAVVTGGGTSLPLFHPVSRTLGTYRKWEGEGQGGRRGCSPLPITSSDIQANILPLPVTSSPLCLFPSRLEDTLPLFPRVTVCVRPSIPWGIFEGPARRKRIVAFASRTKIPPGDFRPSFWRMENALNTGEILYRGRGIFIQVRE